jgi:hypothetical protein
LGEEEDDDDDEGGKNGKEKEAKGKMGRERFKKKTGQLALPFLPLSSFLSFSSFLCLPSCLFPLENEWKYLVLQIGKLPRLGLHLASQPSHQPPKPLALQRTLLQRFL